MPKTCKATNCSLPVFGKGYCQRHQYLRLDKILKPPPPQRHIKKFSDRTRKKVGEYIALRELFLKEFPLCTTHLMGCEKIATEIHHMKGRGIYLNDVGTWLPVCRYCHHWIEMHPSEAKTLGFSQSRLK